MLAGMEIDKGAKFSQSKKHRYLLWRIWDDELPLVAFIGLNPSVAGAEQDDPTIRREIGFAKSWGYGGILKVNLFGYITPYPVQMRSFMENGGDPIGAGNDMAIIEAANRADKIVCAWGESGVIDNRDYEVRLLLAKRGIDTYYLRLNQSGTPAHTLYLPKTLTPKLWPEQW